MESPESQLSNLLFFVEFWLNLVIFVGVLNRDLRFPKLHENHKNADFTSKNAPKIKDFDIFMEFWKAEIQGFPSAEESASEDITIKSYGDFEIPQNSKKLIEK